MSSFFESVEIEDSSTTITRTNKLKIGKDSSVYFAYSHPVLRSAMYDGVTVERRVNQQVAEVYDFTTNQGKAQIKLPKCAISYNWNMCGSDVLDRKISQFKTLHATNRWWTRCFFFYIDIILINCHILYRQYHPDEL